MPFLSILSCLQCGAYLSDGADIITTLSNGYLLEINAEKYGWKRVGRDWSCPRCASALPKLGQSPEPDAAQKG
jgi:hypothetical protein